MRTSIPVKAHLALELKTKKIHEKLPSAKMIDTEDGKWTTVDITDMIWNITEEWKLNLKFLSRGLFVDPKQLIKEEETPFIVLFYNEGQDAIMDDDMNKQEALTRRKRIVEIKYEPWGVKEGHVQITTNIC